MFLLKLLKFNEYLRISFGLYTKLLFYNLFLIFIEFLRNVFELRPKNLFYISVDPFESKVEEVALNLLLDFRILKVDDLVNFFGFFGFLGSD